MTKKKYISPFEGAKNKHDVFVKKALENHPEVAKEFLQTHLSKSLVNKLDLTRLEFEHTETFKGTGGQLVGDVIIKCPLKESGESVYLVLIEHQSQNDSLMSLRVLEYQVYLLRKWVEKQKRQGIPYDAIQLPFIYPTVIYHGRSTCTFSNDINDLVQAPRELVDNYFLKPFRLIDFQAADDKALANQNLAGLMGLMLKYIFKGLDEEFKQFHAVFKEYINNNKELKGNEAAALFLVFALEYLLAAGQFSQKDAILSIIDEVETVSPESREQLMTIADMLRQDGHEAGMQQGILTGQIRLLSRLLRRKFGPLSPRQEELLARLSMDELLAASESVLEAESIDEVLQDGPAPTEWQ